MATLKETSQVEKLYAESGKESSRFPGKYRLFRRISKQDKRHSAKPSDSTVERLSKDNNVSSDLVTVVSDDKLTGSLIEENDNLRNRNTALRYQVELLSEHLGDLRDLNLDFKSQNSRLREENSLLRNEQAQLASKNDSLLEQIVVLRQMLEDVGITLDERASGQEEEEEEAEDEDGCGLPRGRRCEEILGLGAPVPCSDYDPGTPASHRKPPIAAMTHDHNLTFL